MSGKERVPDNKEGKALGAAVADVVVPAVQPFVDSAALSAAFAEAFAGPVHVSVAAGEAATRPDQVFRVNNGNGTLTAYLRTATGSIELKALATTHALASSDDGKGAAMVALRQGGSVSDAINWVTPQAYNAKGNGVDDDTFALKALFSSGRKDILIPKGDYVCDESVFLDALSTMEGAHIRGQGRESRLIFKSGGLVLRGNGPKNCIIENFQVEMRGAGQIDIDFFDESSASSGTRWAMRDIRVRSAKVAHNTGIRIRGGWIASMFNPIVQACRTGIQITKSPHAPFVAFNSLSLFGGEIQGNGTGVDAEGVLSLNFFGTAIEGNRLNGVLLRSGCRNVSFDGVYFETNGIDNRTSTNDVRIEVENPLDTLYSVSFRSTVHLNGGVGAQDAIWVNKCSALLIDDQCSFNGYTNRLVVDEMAPNVVSGAMRAIAPNTTIPWVNNSNAFGAPKEVAYSFGGVEMLDAATTRASDVFFALPDTAAKFGKIMLLYTAAAAGDVVFQITPYDLSTGTTLPELNIVATAGAGRNLAASAIDLGSRLMRGKDMAVVVSRLGASSSDTNTGTINLNALTIRTHQ